VTQPSLRNADALPHPLRDYEWVSSVLPGKVGPTDLDFVLERNGKVLILEFKPEFVEPGLGQLLTLITLHRMGATVWLVQGEWGTVKLRPLRGSRWDDGFPVTQEGLAFKVRDWFLNA